MAAVPTPYLVALCTCPDLETAESIAGTLVAAGLAACVNVVPGVTSIYLWQGEVQKEGEVLLVMKTRADRFEQLCGEVVRLHPYELPEVVAVALHTGFTPYLRWIDECVTRT